MFRLIKDWSIQTKLIIAFSLFIFFPILIIGYISYQRFAGTIDNQAIQFNSKMIRNINRDIDYTVGEIDHISLIPVTDDNVLNALAGIGQAKGLELLDMRQTIYRMIKNMLQLRPDISGVYIYPANYPSFREVLYMTEYYHLGYDVDVSQEDWYKMVLKTNGEKYLLSSHSNDKSRADDSSMVFSLSRKIMDPRNSLKELGIVLVDVNLNSIRDICENSSYGSSGEIIITDQKGSIIYDSSGIKKGNITVNELKGILPNKEGNFKIKLNGRLSLVSLNTSSYTGWTVTELIPLEELNQGSEAVRNVTMLIGLICLALGSLMAVYIAKGISNPVRRLQRMMRLAENGDFDVQVTNQTKDEVGQLSSSFNIMIKKIKDLMQNVYDSRLMEKEAELEALQSQINPHFLYNTLDVVRGIAMANNVESIVQISGALGSMFRYNISNDRKIVRLRDEIEHIENYIQIQKFRYGDKFDVFYDIDEELYQCKIIRMIIQPLIENAIYHGIEMMMGRGEITVRGRKEGSNLLLSVEDNGLGIIQEKSVVLNNALEQGEWKISRSDQTGIGIGILNVNARIKLYYGKEFGLKVVSRQNAGTAVLIIMPAVI